MVVTDAFRFRKNKVRTPIQYAWCAANTKNFVGPSATKISKKEIDDLDISSLCDEIRSDLTEEPRKKRLTLYLASMLTSGTTRLFYQQAAFLENDCEKFMLELLGEKDPVSQKKKKKTTKVKTVNEVPDEDQINVNVISIPQIDVVKILGKKTYKDDHLLSEVDFVDICEPPQSFGFNGIENELTDRQMQNMFREFMGEDQEMATQEERPQDNQSFKMNDAPVYQEPDVNVEKERTPPNSPSLRYPGMITPKKNYGRSKNVPPMSSSSSERAKTAFSPVKKRPRTADVPQNDANINEVMVGSEPPMEAAFPHEAPREADVVSSPVFDFRKRTRRHNITAPLQIHREDAVEKAFVPEPMIDDHAQPEVPPADATINDPQIELPNVSFNDPPLEVEQPPAEIQRDPNASTPMHRGLPKASSTLSNLSLDAINSFEEHSRKMYIRKGNKIFADRIKQIDHVPCPPTFMTMSRQEAMFPPALKYQSVTSLFNQPATLKNKRYLPAHRHWSEELLRIYYERTLPLLIEKKTAPKKKRAREQSVENNERREEPNSVEDIENQEINQEQREPPLPDNIAMNDEQDIQLPEPQPKDRTDLIPEDNQMDVDVHAPPANVQTEKPENLSESNVVHDAAYEFEQPPIVEPVIEPPSTVEPIIEQPPTREPVIEQPPTVEQVIEQPRTPPGPEIDQIESVMSPPKRFKSRDDKDLRAGEVSNKNLTIDDLFKIIQSFWEKLSKRDIHRLKSIKVTYENVIKPGHYNGVEAARYLQYCLILDKMEKLRIEQNAPYDSVYLIKN